MANGALPKPDLTEEEKLDWIDMKNKKLNVRYGRQSIT